MRRFTSIVEHGWSNALQRQNTNYKKMLNACCAWAEAQKNRDSSSKMLGKVVLEFS